jgi:secreted trypsin-like serine protease
MSVWFQLSSSVPSSIAVPIRLNEDSNEPQVGDSLTVMGWGTTILGESAEPDVLQEVDVSYLSNNACRFSYPNQGVTNDMMCCLEAGQGSCQGDSGGPLIIPGANSAGDVQAGIVSWGILCALDAYPGELCYSISCCILDYLCRGVSLTQIVPLNRFV